MLVSQKYIPADFPGKTKSKYKVDGAACFDSGYSHALQTMWEIWTTITEESYRVSISGCGKTMLDSMFAHLQRWMKRAANGGTSFFDASTCFAAATKGGGLKSTMFAVFLPVRPDDSSKTTVEKLGDYHESVREVDTDGTVRLRGRKHSGHGPGVTTLVHGPAAWEDGELPPQPQFTFEEQVGTERHQPVRAPDGKSAERQQSKRQAVVASKQARAELQWSTKAEEQQAAGLFPCEEEDPVTTLPCRRLYATKKGLAAHCVRCDDPGSKEDHRSYGGHSAHDVLVRMAADPQNGFAAGTRVNTSAASKARPVAALEGRLEAGTALEYGAKATSRCGQYRKPAREKSYRKTELQVQLLKQWWGAGQVVGATKWSGERARAEMATMRHPAGHRHAGRRVFSRRVDPNPIDGEPGVPNPCGILLAADKIKQYFASLTQDAKKGPKKAKTGMAAYTVADLKDLLKTKNLSTTGKKGELWARLEGAVKDSHFEPSVLRPEGWDGSSAEAYKETDIARHEGGSVSITDAPRRGGGGAVRIEIAASGAAQVAGAHGEPAAPVVACPVRAEPTAGTSSGNIATSPAPVGRRRRNVPSVYAR